MADPGEATVVTSYFPLPVTSGGRKRVTRLLEAIERSGLGIRILSLDNIEDGVAQARERGWAVEIFPSPTGTIASRLRQHAELHPRPMSGPLVQRITELSRSSVFMQFEEIASAQYVRNVQRMAPTVLSLHNVDSKVARMNLDNDGRRDPRSMYYWARMAYTERRAVRAADAVFCVSEHDRQHFAALGARSAQLISNGVDDEFLTLPEGLGRTGRVLFFGTFGWKPNGDGLRRFIVHAWPRIRAARPDAELRVVGGRADEAIGDLAGEDGVNVVGFVDDLHAELAEARVVIAPLWVGGGTRIKVLEALASARPVVGTSVGVEQIGFIDQRDGLIADTTDGLADAVLRVLDDDELALRLARNGRALGSRFRWTEVTAPAVDLYRRFVEQQSGRAGARPR